MKGTDDGVRAMALGLRSEPFREQADEKAADRGREGNEPEAVGTDYLGRAVPLAGESGRLVVGDTAE